MKYLLIAPILLALYILGAWWFARVEWIEVQYEDLPGEDNSIVRIDKNTTSKEYTQEEKEKVYEYLANMCEDTIPHNIDSCNIVRSEVTDEDVENAEWNARRLFLQAYPEERLYFELDTIKQLLRELKDAK